MRTSLFASLVCISVSLFAVNASAQSVTAGGTKVTVTDGTGDMTVKTDGTGTTIKNGGATVKTGATTTTATTTGANRAKVTTRTTARVGQRVIRCADEDQKIVIRKEKIRAKGKFAVVIQGSCNVLFDQVWIKGAGGIKAQGNATITIKRSEIVASRAALSVHGNGDVRVKRSRLVSKTGAAIVLRGNADVHVVKRSKLRSAKGKPAVVVLGNGSVYVGPKSKINGKTSKEMRTFER